MSSDFESVRVERDNGFRERWAFGRYFYRKEAQKTSISMKRVAMAVAALFGASSFILLLKGNDNGVQTKAKALDMPREIDQAGSNYQNFPPAVVGRKRIANSQPAEALAVKFKGIEHVERPRLDTIPIGVMTEAEITNTASDGRVFAKLTTDLLFQGDIIVPKGSTLIGSGSSLDDRLNIKFEKIRFEDGKAQTISAVALDQSDHGVGVKGSKVSKYAAMMAAAGALSFAGGLAEGLQERENLNGISVRKSDLRNATLNGAGRAAIDTSKEVISSWKDKKTVVQVKAGTLVEVVFGDK